MAVVMFAIFLLISSYFLYQLQINEEMARLREERAEAVARIREAVRNADITWSQSNGTLRLRIANHHTEPLAVLGVIVIYVDGSYDLHNSTESPIYVGPGEERVLAFPTRGSVQSVRLALLKDMPAVAVSAEKEVVAPAPPPTTTPPPTTPTPTPTPPQNVWHFRIKVRVVSQFERTFYPVVVGPIDFTRIVLQLTGRLYTFDENSIRVTDSQGSMLQFNFTKANDYDARDNARGWITFKVDYLAPGSAYDFYIYFDVVTNEYPRKQPPSQALHYPIGYLKSVYGDGTSDDSYYWVLVCGLEDFIPYRTTGRFWYGSDDRYFRDSLGFRFPFYGRHYTYIYVVSNGFLPTSPTVDWSNSFWEFRLRRGVYPFWDDLYRVRVYYDGGVLHRMESRYYHYYANYYYGRSRVADFTVTLFESGDIVFQWRRLDLVGSYTSGISNGDGRNYLLLHSYDTRAGILGPDRRFIAGKSIIFVYKPNLQVEILGYEQGAWPLSG